MLSEHWQTKATAAADGQEKVGRAAVLGHLAALRFRGNDVENFLQGYLTSDLGDLIDAAPHLSALVNLKGRVVANGWARLSAEGQIDWILDASLAGTVRDFMQRYLAFSRTELKLLEQDRLIVGLVGANGHPTAQVVERATEIDGILANHTSITETDWHLACIDAGIVLVSDDTSEAFLPQMLGLVAAGAIDFDKGCYLGQEVVARAQHRGEVKRGLTRLLGDAAALQPGETLTDDSGVERGVVINTASDRCLAVVRQPPSPAYLAGAARLIPDQL